MTTTNKTCDFLALHIWQIRQLSRAEYLTANKTARGTIGPGGLNLYGAAALQQLGA